MEERLDSVHTVLVVEDEKEISDLLCLHLTRAGFSTKQCFKGGEAVQGINSQVSLVLLDWMLPEENGIEILKKIRQSNLDIPVVMITAKSEPEDIVLALESGADDYIVKPFDYNVLIARVKTQLRRLNSHGKKYNHQILKFGSVEMNIDAHEVYLDGEMLELTNSEFKLLQNLIQNTGKVLTRDQLVSKVQGEDVNVTGRTIDTHIFGLRKKLQENSDLIETIRGVGYRINLGDSK